MAEHEQDSEALPPLTVALLTSAPAVGTSQMDAAPLGTPPLGTPLAGVPQMDTSPMDTPIAGAWQTDTPPGGTSPMGAPEAGASEAGAPQVGAPLLGVPLLGAPPLGTPPLGTPFAGGALATGPTIAAPPSPFATPLPWGQAFAQVAWSVVALVVVFFAGVWPNLPFTTERKWIVTGVVFAIIAALSVAAFIMIRARSVAFFKSLRDTIEVIAIAGGAALAALLFTPAIRNEVFKLFVIVYFSLLPAFLYLQFISVRGPTLWEEFTENLYRLRLDDAASLPRPAPHSRYHRVWSAAQSTDRTTGMTRTLYQKKFEGVFGTVPADDKARSVLQTEKLAPVIMATILFSVAWVIVVMPSPLFELSPFGRTPGATESPLLPVETLRFGFLGAYFYAVQMLVRRYFQNDLKASAYLNATMRIVIVALLTWTVDLGLHNEPQSYRSSLAFVIGVFPDVGWNALQALVKMPLRPLVRSLRQLYPLSDLDGLNVWYEARLLEEGVEDMQNLATCNLVDVMLNTRIPVERLIDWVDQSILYLHLGKPAQDNAEGAREQLRRYGIRTATDLEDAFQPMPNSGDEAGRIAKLERLLTASNDEPSVLRTILASLQREPNVSYVRAWRRTEQIS